MFLHLDCRHFLGDRPCKFNRLCEGCGDYEPMGPRVLIIKLGALGDVVRTAALLPGLTQRTVDEPYVTWLTSPAALDLVKRMKGVHRAWAYNEESLARLRVEKFDWVISLDKEPGPCSVAMNVQADNKVGIGLSRYGTPFPLTEDADYYFQLGLDNDEKFHRNKLSYQQLMYEALGFRYEGQRYEIELTEADLAAADRVFRSFKDTKLLPGKIEWIGINPGAGNVFAHKAWREEGYVNLIRALAEERPNARCVLLGGEDEAVLIARILSAVGKIPVYHAGTNHSLGAFAAILDRCNVVVCGDTLAMHLAIARGRRVVAIFGPTCEQEIDLFGKGVKIKSPIECSPCYLRKCDKSPHCQDLNTDQMVLKVTIDQLAAS